MNETIASERKFSLEKTTFRFQYFDLLIQLKAFISELHSSEQIFVHSQSTGLRTIIFKLQGIGKVLKDFESEFVSRKDTKKIRRYFGEMRDTSKIFEDVLGQYGKSFETRNAVSAMVKNDPTPYLKAADDLIQKEKIIFKKFLKQTHWLSLTSKGKLEQLRIDALALNWPDESELQDYVVKTIIDYGIKVQQKLESDEMANLIMKSEYDYPALELGLHEVRRSLRWLAIMIQNFDLFFSRSAIPANLNKDDFELIEEYSNSSLTQLRGNTETKNPALVDAISYFKLNKFISDLGILKDIGEARFFVPRLLDNDSLFCFDKETEAQELVKSIIESKVLTKLISS